MPIQDKLFSVQKNNGVLLHKNSKSTVLRVVVITKNKQKFEEFRAQLGDGYGMDVQQWEDAPEDLNEEALIEVCKQIMATQTYSPHFILREETSLKSRRNDEDLTHLSLDDLAKRSQEQVIHTSTLKVIKPQWNKTKAEEPLLALDDELAGFTLRKYEKRSHGYIKRGKIAQCKQGFGWDALFVNAATNLTNEEFYLRYGKKSARQHTISDFIETYLRYKTLLTLKHHQIKMDRPISFGKHYVHLPDFIQAEKHLSNPFIDMWGIERLRNMVLNEGMFFKGAWSRPVKNYFSPPFSGVPLTAKKDDAEETTFMTHDMMHHLISDLVCDIEPSKDNFYVYNAWRMTSEAFTMILADMLYADSLIKNGVPSTCVDKRIYPLFVCIKHVHNILDPDLMTADAKMAFIKKLLFANVTYALLGDDSEWKTLLTQANGAIDPDHLACLDAYKDHFGKFFIGDNAWTRANYDNMHKHHSPLSTWINSVGKEQFRKSNIPLLSDMVQAVKEEQADTTDYKNVVHRIFDIAFKKRVAPGLHCNRVPLDAKEDLQSRAFRRYLIGQSSLFARYPTPFNLEYIPPYIFARIQNDAPFSNEEQDELRAQLEQYILGLEGVRLMSNEEALNAIDCTPVFPPVYISYAQMQKQYTSIASCVSQCIEGYSEPATAKKAIMTTNPFLFLHQTSGDSPSSPAKGLQP